MRSSSSTITARLKRIKMLADDLARLSDPRTAVAETIAAGIKQEIDAALRTLKHAEKRREDERIKYR